MEKTKSFSIPKKLFVEAFKRVKVNAGAAGVDLESLADFERNLKDNLYRLWNRMSSGSYMPPAVKALPIPKKSGGTRILGVPTVGDRDSLVQRKAFRGYKACRRFTYLDTPCIDTMRQTCSGRRDKN